MMQWRHSGHSLNDIVNPPRYTHSSCECLVAQVSPTVALSCSTNGLIKTSPRRAVRHECVERGREPTVVLQRFSPISFDYDPFTTRLFSALQVGNGIGNLKTIY
jgi:hypothetical protein